jgi:hypothetical protein
MELADVLKVLGGFVVALWAIYKFWFKASTSQFVTKAEMKILETDVLSVKTAIAKMEGDLKTHIELTKQHNTFVQNQLDRVEESQKELKADMNKNFDHLIGNIKQWSRSQENASKLDKIAEKLSV